MKKSQIVRFATSVLVLCIAPRVGYAQNGNGLGLPPEPQSAEAESQAVGNDQGLPPEPAQPKPPVIRPILLRDYLVLPKVGRYGRTPFHQDAIEAQLVLDQFTPPQAGDRVGLPDERQQIWQPAKAGKDGWLGHSALRGGYAYAKVESPHDRIALLAAQGHSAVYVNGQPRVGDPYVTGTVRLPVQLRKGINHLLFHVGTGRVRAELRIPRQPVSLDLTDTTLPDLIAGESDAKWAAAVVVNATDTTLTGCTLVCNHPSGQPLTTPLASIPPLSVFKAPFQLDGHVRGGVKEIEYELQVVAQDQWIAGAAFRLPVVQPTDLHKRTFVSEIDGSVQYYAVRPGKPREKGDPRPYGMILALHGSGVEATKYAAYYEAKEWAHVVAPTNRRKYGFDWEDWGRLDAIEALSGAQKQYKTDPRRTYLTGHAMGGHGAWHLGANYPGHFAAVGPSAGWISFWSYGGMPKHEGNPSPIEKLLLRGSLPSDTSVLSANLGAMGVSILHGQSDTSVPVAQSRFMREQLSKFHTNFVYYEQPGAGHFWGNRCCDWPPMMAFFQHHRLPDFDKVRRVSFITANPGVSSRIYWLSIERQLEPFMPSRVVITCDPEKRKFSGKTTNVSWLSLDLRHVRPGGRITIELDGHRMSGIRVTGKTKRVWCRRHDDHWHVENKPPPPSVKGPHRYGAFKDVFRHRAVLVYGTRGGEEENTWAFAKARYDAESFWYRGNGALQVVADTEFRPTDYKDRSVILYGNADTNAAWPALLSTSPVQVRRGSISIDARRELDNDLACLFIRPRHDSPTASVGVVSATGLAGFRATNRLRYFVSGVAYPDLTIFDPGVLTEGTPAIRGLGYFGEDWSVEKGDLEWRDVAL